MALGDIVSLVAGDPVAIETINDNFSKLQATVQALPPANLLNNRAPFVVGAYVETLANGQSRRCIYFRNVFGVDGLRLVSVQCHVSTAANGCSVLVEKSTTADFAAPTTMGNLTLVSVAEAGFRYDALQPAANVENLPDSSWIRATLTNATGAGIDYVYVSLHFDMILRPKA